MAAPASIWRHRCPSSGAGQQPRPCHVEEGTMPVPHHHGRCLGRAKAAAVDLGAVPGSPGRHSVPLGPPARLGLTPWDPQFDLGSPYIHLAASVPFLWGWAAAQAPPCSGRHHARSSPWQAVGTGRGCGGLRGGPRFARGALGPSGPPGSPGSHDPLGPLVRPWQPLHPLGGIGALPLGLGSSPGPAM